MKFGVKFHQAGRAEDLGDFAREAESHGFESLWRGEHIIVPREIRSVDPYYARSLPPAIESFHVMDPSVVLAYVAARTERIRLGIGAFLLPLRHPVEAARQLMTLDVMSGGRLEVAVGMGWLREEFDILDQPWANRGRRAEEAIAILRTLWTEPHPEHTGTHYRMAPVSFGPKPVQRPHPPILISGVSPIALSRAGRLGDGWYGHDLPADVARRCVAQIQRVRDECGRADQPFEFTSRVAGSCEPREVEALAAAGITRVVVDVGTFESHGRDAVLRNIERVQREVISVFQEDPHATG